MSINVGELVATMKLDDAQFQRGLASAPGAARSAFAGVGEAGETEGRRAGQGLSTGINQGIGQAQTAAQTGGRATGSGFARAFEGSLAPVSVIAGQAGRQAGTELGTETERAATASGGRMQQAGAQVGAQFVGGIRQVIVQVGALFAGAKIAQFFLDAKNAASDLNETVSKSSTVFGANFKQIETWSKTAATSMGLSQQAALDASAGFGEMFTQFGLTGSAAADLSMQTVQLAADLGSYNNLPTADVLDKISGAFRGEFDSIQALIPNISAARVEHEAMAETGKTSAASLTASEKAMATLTIVSRDGANAIGDYAKTADGVANTEKTLAAQFDDTKAALGQRLMPIWQAFLGLLSGAMGVLASVVGPVADMVTWFTELPGPVQLGALAFAAWTLAVGPAIGAMLRFIATSGGVTAAAGRVTGAMLGAFGGPIGLAILGVTAAIGVFMSTTSEAEPVAVSFADAIDQATGKLKENAQATIQNAAANAGHVDALKAVGVAADTYSAALAGNKTALEETHTAILDAATAAVKGSVAWGRMVASGDKLPGQAREVASGLLASGDAGAFAGAGMDVAMTASETLALDMSSLETESRRAAQSTEGVGGAAHKAGAGADEANTPMQNLAAATKALGGAATDADTATNFLIASLNAMNGGAVTAEQAANLAAAAMRGVGAAQRDQQAASDGLLTAQIAVSDATGKLADVTSHLGDSNEETRTTAEDQMSAQLALNDANRGLVDATDAVSDANEGLSKANLDARDAAVKNATSAFTLAGGFNNLDGATAAATAKIEEARAAFIRTQPQADILSGKADATARSLFGIPGDVNTFIREQGAANVQGQAGSTTGAINQIPTSHNTNISITGGAQDVANNIRASIEQIPGYKQIVIESIARGQNIPTPHLGGRLHGGGAAFAGGGAAPDVGPWQSDSIVGLWHRGEHVLDAQDVTRMGGQAAVYGFRDALSAGGPVDAAMRILAANGGLPGASAPPAIAGPAQGMSGRQVQFTGPITVGKFDDAQALINHAILAAF